MIKRIIYKLKGYEPLIILISKIKHKFFTFIVDIADLFNFDPDKKIEKMNWLDKKIFIIYYKSIKGTYKEVYYETKYKEVKG